MATLTGGITASCGVGMGAIISGGANAVLDIMSGERNLKKLAVSAAIGAGSSLVGSGIGKAAEKIGGKMAFNQLNKLSKDKIKAKITSLHPVKGNQRNLTKNILDKKGRSEIGSKLLGKSIPTAFSSLSRGFAGVGANYLRSRYTLV